ncbi:MAG: hypothetical protein WBX27_09080 [Specibacter sp.]
MEWRDLPDENWSNEVVTAQGPTGPVSETVWMPTREGWLHAVDLNNGACFADIPTNVGERLLTDIANAWKTRGTDAGLIIDVGESETRLGDASNPYAVMVSGPLTAITAWASGRATIPGAPRAPAWI